MRRELMRDEEPTKSECLDESGERWRRAVGQRCSAGEADFDRGRRERAIAARAVRVYGQRMRRGMEGKISVSQNWWRAIYCESEA
jgi:hypothetical protein